MSNIKRCFSALSISAIGLYCGNTAQANEMLGFTQINDISVSFTENNGIRQLTQTLPTENLLAQLSSQPIQNATIQSAGNTEPASNSATSQTSHPENAQGNFSFGVDYNSEDGGALFMHLGRSNWNTNGESTNFDVRLGHYRSNIELNNRHTFSWLGSNFAEEYASAQDIRPVIEKDTYRFTTGELGFRLHQNISKNSLLTYGTALELAHTTTYIDASNELRNYVQKQGSSTWASTLKAAWKYDTRLLSDRGLRSGNFLSANAVVSLPIGTARYAKLDLVNENYFPINNLMYAGLAESIGIANGYSGRYGLPIYRSYYGGGVGSVRGYSQGSLGPKDSLGNPIGSKSKMVINAELAIRLGELMKKPIFGLIFFDAGQFSGTDYGTNETRIYKSTGLGVTWHSNIGLLNFYISKPLATRPNDNKQIFQIELKANSF